jgi:predicted metal-dependent phosphoesterase TrpH
VAVKVDLHTHSIGSSDGGLTLDDYRRALEQGKLDYIAITDHGEVKAARKIRQDLKSLGNRIIIGEEIKTTDGEIIGLYLKNKIPFWMTPMQTVKEIKKQGGVVYIPHPFEVVRSGISQSALQEIIKEVDIIETYNSRALFKKKRNMAAAMAKRHGVAQAASSDAHGSMGWGKTYSVLAQAPARDTIKQLFTKASHHKKATRLGILYPMINRVIKKRDAS